MVKERLINDNVFSIIDQLHKFEFGEHNILVYPDFDALRDLYSHHCKKRLEQDNEIVLLLPHYETVANVRFALKELDINVEHYEKEGLLIIMDAIDAIFNPTTREFIAYLAGLESRARSKGRKGVCVIADMGPFYHMRKIDQLVEYETSIPPTQPNVKSSLLCVYHAKDFDRLDQDKKDSICKSHFREIIVSKNAENGQ